MLECAFNCCFIPVGVVRLRSFISSYFYEGTVAVQQNGVEVQNYLFNQDGVFTLEGVTLSAKFESDKIAEIRSVESVTKHIVVTSGFDQLIPSFKIVYGELKPSFALLQTLPDSAVLHGL